MNEKILEQHLQSSKHLKMERRMVRAEAGLEAFVAECEERVSAKNAQESGISKRKQKNAEFASRQKERRQAVRQAGKTSERFRKNRNTDPSAEEIETMKRRFQDKKARRLARREAAGDKEALTTAIPNEAQAA